MRKLLLALIALLALVSCRTVRESGTTARVIEHRDTIQQHFFVHRTDTVLIHKTDSGTSRREKTQIVIYAADKESHREAQRDTVLLVKSNTSTMPGKSADVQTLIFLAIILLLLIRRK